MSDSDQKFRRVKDLMQDEYVLEGENSAAYASEGSTALADSWRGRYVELFEFSPVPYFIFSPLGIVEEVNLAGCQMLQVGPGEIVGRELHDALRIDRQESLEFVETILETNQTVEIETFRSGAPCRIVGARVDQGAERIRVAIIEFPQSSEKDDARLTNVLLQAKDGFLFFDRDGSLLRMNRQARMMLKSQPTDSADALLTSLDSQLNFEEIRNALQQTNHWVRDFESTKPHHVLRLFANSVVDEDIDLEEILVTVREVPHQAGRPHEKSLRRLREQTKEPIAALMGALELVNSIGDADSISTLIEIAERNARVLQIALANVHPPSEAQFVDRIPQSIGPLISNAIDTAQFLYPDVRFVRRGEPDAIFPCDTYKFTQAIHNVLRTIMTESGGLSNVVLQLHKEVDVIVIEVFANHVETLGLEESSVALVQTDFQIAKEILDRHGGSVSRWGEPQPRVRIELR